jgi:hypothetical protein
MPAFFIFDYAKENCMPTVSKPLQPEVSTATLTPANAPIKQSAATIGTGTGAVHGGISSLFTGAAQWIKNIISYLIFRT